MNFCKNSKKTRPPLKPREGEYKKTNAYTKKMCVQQILTLALAFTVVLLHSVFLVAPIIKIDHIVLYIMLAFNYAFVAGLITTYIQITTFDPVDRYITNPQLPELNKDQTRSYCGLCCSYIHQRSYHCKRCNRCTQNFDHHCVYLNSCIGSLNYELFLRILIFYIIFLLNNIGQAIWVFFAARTSQQVKAATITQWMPIAIIIICFLQIVATVVLLSFHCYISCCLDVTTLMFMESEERSQRSRSSHSQNVPEQKYQQYSPSHLDPHIKFDTKQNIFQGYIV